jgi:hypothetical protein
VDFREADLDKHDNLEFFSTVLRSALSVSFVRVEYFFASDEELSGEFGLLGVLL